MNMKMTTVFLFLVTIATVYAQTGKQVSVSLGAKGNTLQFSIFADGVFLAGSFEGKLNGKAIGFERKGTGPVMIINGKMLSDKEIQLIENWADVMKSALKRDKFKMPGISFKLKAEGKTLQADVRSSGAVFEGKFEGTINGKPIEFKSDAGDCIFHRTPVRRVSDKGRYVNFPTSPDGVCHPSSSQNRHYTPAMFVSL